ncbi:hypothetical protein ES703_105478 [subsurface metagenome]
MSEQRDKQARLREEFKSAVQDETIPVFYFNSFTNTMSSGDVAILFKRTGRPTAILYASYTVAKSLAVKLGEMISELERRIGQKIMTTDDMEQLLARSAGGDDNDNDVDE